MDSLKARVFALALPAIGLFVSGPAVDATASEINQIPAVTDGVAVTSNEALLNSAADLASTPSLNFVRRMSAADFERSRSAAQSKAAAGISKTESGASQSEQIAKADDVAKQVMVVDTTPEPATGSLVSYDEPVIQVARKDTRPSMKQDFYDKQLEVAQKSETALELRPASQSKAVEHVADARSKTADKPLRQPGTYNYPVTNVEPVKTASVKAVSTVVKQLKPQSKPQPKAQPKPAGGWSPVDIRTVNVSNQVDEAEVQATQATASDKAQAQKAVQLGFELIQRRAHYSARARFVQSLRIVARSLDDQTFTTRHTTALRNALAAYEEAVDFYPTSAKPDEDVNLYMILGGHKTPVLANADANRLTPRQCVREYMAYAEQEFTMALGNDGFASQALYGLGRLEASKDTASTSAPQVRANRSLMLYQTSILVDQRNYAAANELGVLLARYGKFNNAVSALQHCVKFSPEPTAWKNLANIYRRMGKNNEARVAESRASRTLASKPRAPFVANQPKVEWVKSDAFVAMNANSNMQVTRTAQLPNVARQPAVAPARNMAPMRGSLPTKTANRKSFWPFGGNK